MFRNRTRNDGRRGSSPVRARDRKRQPSLESLEGRRLMSVGPEFVGPINSTTRGGQFDSDVASSSNGMSVVVWTDTVSSSDHDIRAQLYNRFRQKQGPEFIVSGSVRDDVSPSAAMDPRGNFV